MERKELLAVGGAASYAVAVENSRLWHFLGAELARIRLRAGYSSTLALAKDERAAPAKNTLDDIERGRPGTIEKIEAYCAVLGVNVSEVLRTILADDDTTPLSADARFVAEMFQDGPNEDLREAILAAAKAQHALQRAGHGSTLAPPVAPAQVATGSHGRVRRSRTQ